MNDIKYTKRLVTAKLNLDNRNELRIKNCC
jgi:hypothetical protein